MIADPDRRGDSGGKSTVYRRYPRTSHKIAKPNMALKSPTKRNPWSGVCVITATARLAASGNAAKMSPSMTNTSPSAAKKSVIGFFGKTAMDYRHGLLSSCLRRLFGRFPASRIAEILEEIGIRPQHEPGIVGT
jgi:hypothetical protein